MSHATIEPPTCRHNYDVKTSIPMNLKNVESTLEKATVELRMLLHQLRFHGGLKPESSQPTKKRKVQTQQIDISQRFETVVHKIMRTKDWAGQCEIDGLMEAHKTEFRRKWGGPDGVYHDLLQIYPECRLEILEDQERHEYITGVSAEIRWLCSQVLVEGNRLSRLEMLRNTQENDSNKKAER